MNPDRTTHAPDTQYNDFITYSIRDMKLIYKKGQGMYGIVNLSDRQGEMAKTPVSNIVILSGIINILIIDTRI